MDLGQEQAVIHSTVLLGQHWQEAGKEPHVATQKLGRSVAI